MGNDLFQKGPAIPKNSSGYAIQVILSTEFILHQQGDEAAAVHPAFNPLRSILFTGHAPF